MNNIKPLETNLEQEAVKKENIQLKIQVEKLKAQVSSLQEELQVLDDGVERLPLIRFIEYAETYPPEQNEHARTLKEALRDVYTSFSQEERIRLRALGHKPQVLIGLTVNEPHTDIHHDRHVENHIHYEKAPATHCATPSEQRVKTALEGLLTATDKDDKRIFTQQYQWYAVWKVLQEYQYPKNYQAFADLMSGMLGDTNPPCKAESIRKIGNDVAGAANNLAYWKSCRDKADGKFKNLIAVAMTLMEQLAQ